MSNYKQECEKVVAVLGVGTIGLPLSILAANSGFKVYAVDKKKSRVQDILSHSSGVFEQGLLDLFKQSYASRSLTISTRLDVQADIFIVCVPTPLDKNMNPDLSFVYQALTDIKPFIKKNSLIIIESTIPVGTLCKLASFLSSQNFKVGADLFLAYSPERMLPGNALSEQVNNKRIVGGFTDTCAKKAANFYKNFVKADICLTNSKTAEAVKLLENSFRLVQVSLSIQASNIASEFDIDDSEVIKLANFHPRVEYLNPGIGVGGPCIGYHPYFLKNRQGEVPPLFASSLKIVQQREDDIFAKILTGLEGFKKTNQIAKPKIAVLGLSYKPDVADLRNSPAVRISRRLYEYKNCLLGCFEPMVDDSEILFLGLPPLKEEELKNADILILLVPHKQFFGLLKITKKLVIDPARFLSGFSNLEKKGSAIFKESCSEKTVS